MSTREAICEMEHSQSLQVLQMGRELQVPPKMTELLLTEDAHKNQNCLLFWLQVSGLCFYPDWYFMAGIWK